MTEIRPRQRTSYIICEKSPHGATRDALEGMSALEESFSSPVFVEGLPIRLTWFGSRWKLLCWWWPQNPSTKLHQSTQKLNISCSPQTVVENTDNKLSILDNGMQTKLMALWWTRFEHRTTKKEFNGAQRASVMSRAVSSSLYKVTKQRSSRRRKKMMLNCVNDAKYMAKRLKSWFCMFLFFALTSAHAPPVVHH